MGKKYSKAITFRHLYRALRISCRSTRWKDSTAGYEANALKNTYNLCRSLEGHGKPYRIDPYQRFTIYEPKKRAIVATRIKDRQFQRSLCDDVLYPELTRHFVYDNCACLRGKGVDFALNRMDCHLQRFYREQKAQGKRKVGPKPTNAGDCLQSTSEPAPQWGVALKGQRFRSVTQEYASARPGLVMAAPVEGWVLACDIHHYFESTPHSVALAAVAKKVRDPEAVARVSQILASFGGETGTGLGSQVSQLVQLAVLDDLDHRIKERHRIRHYIRYMDDFVLIHESKEHLQSVLLDIQEQLAALGLELNKKTRIYPLHQGVKFLQWRFILTATGKVVRKMNPKKISKERRKLRKLKVLQEAGRITMQDIRNNYNSWRANAQRGNTRNLLKQMDAYYTDLFKEAPP